jgi:hypothetical protein
LSSANRMIYHGNNATHAKMWHRRMGSWILFQFQYEKSIFFLSGRQYGLSIDLYVYSGI